jgi:hypothetical protein
LARFDGKLTAAGEAGIDMLDLVQLLAASRSRTDGDRHLAIACYLSASEGWRAAGQALKGAFAPDGGPEGLTGKKEG